MELQAWERIHSQEALAGFVKGCEMKYSQQVEANHGGKEQGEGKAPMSPSADAACSAQQNCRADTDEVGLTGLPPHSQSQEKHSPLPVLSHRRLCMSMCHLCTSAWGESRQGSMLVLGNLASFKFRISAQTHFFPPAIPLCQDFSIFWKHVICLAISVC